MAVLEVHDADDVIAAVRWAVDHGFEVTAQPTGHGGITTLDQTLLLRTRALGGIEVDVQRRTATIGSGVKAGELCDALEGTGLTFLCGSNSDPSVTGMTITGGISWFGRAYGLGADSIVSVEMVDGLGRCRRLSATEDPELFWAVRGGGGDFGIITKLEVALHPCPGGVRRPLHVADREDRRGPAHLQAGHRDRAGAADHLVPRPTSSRRCPSCPSRSAASRSPPSPSPTSGPPRRPSHTWRRTAPSRGWSWTSSARCR